MLNVICIVKWMSPYCWELEDVGGLESSGARRRWGWKVCYQSVTDSCVSKCDSERMKVRDGECNLYYQMDVTLLLGTGRCARTWRH
jgi:hypothetical protein